MNQRAQRLYETADSQITALSVRLSAAGAARLREPCADREKLGDGTVAAVAAHTADNYRRIAGFIAGIRAAGDPHVPRQHHAYSASEVDLDTLLTRLEDARHALAAIRELPDDQLDSLPPAGQIRFADGERTLEQVVASLLRHQRHQIDALTAAL